uniref:Polycystin domain-containing protein n=1 Tax=Glossina austeni TaxID=7395 RepID=A0A1A9VH55_GLOAU
MQQNARNSFAFIFIHILFVTLGKNVSKSAVDTTLDWILYTALSIVYAGMVDVASTGSVSYVDKYQLFHNHYNFSFVDAYKYHGTPHVEYSISDSFEVSLFPAFRLSLYNGNCNNPIPQICFEEHAVTNNEETFSVSPQLKKLSYSTTRLKNGLYKR